MSEELNVLLNNADPIDEHDRRYHALLDDLQCNILSGHGREEARYYFLRFDDPIKAKYLCGMLPRTAVERAMVFTTVDSKILERLPQATRDALINRESAGDPWLLSKPEYEHLESFLLTSEKAVRERNLKRGGGSITGNEDPNDFAVNVLLTHRGYAKLTDEPLPADLAFREGMAKRKLNDPDPWGTDCEHNLADVDALLIVAYNPCARAEARELQNGALTTLDTVLRKHGKLVGAPQLGRALTVELGKISPNAPHDAQAKRVGIEPFGFRDGISQPAFYAADIDEMERRGVVQAPEAAIQEDAARARARARKAAYAPLSLALCPDPNGKTRHACGSYVVFRKLAQDIEKFYNQVAALTDKTRRGEEDVLGDLLGRRRDGAPLASEAGAGTNTFDYRDDGAGARCPFHAHIRKVNPRGDVDFAREQRIVRHGMPYGPAIQRDPTGKPIFDDHGKLVREGVSAAEIGAHEIGLLFLCAQSSIEKQFERIQRDWANNALFAWGKIPGADPIAGQRPPMEANHIRVRRDNPKQSKIEFTFQPVVSFRGGDYFFAPSISFLRGLHDGLWK